MQLPFTPGVVWVYMYMYVFLWVQNVWIFLNSNKEFIVNLSNIVFSPI